MLVPLTMSCLMSAASVQGLSPPLLVAVLQVEGGRVGQEVSNTNGTRDLGPAQVNTLWLPVIARAHNLPEDEVLKALRDDGCYNIHMAAWILRQCLNEYGANTWGGIGCYHSRTPHLNQAYQGRIRRALDRLYGGAEASVVAAPETTMARPRMMVMGETKVEARVLPLDGGAE